MTDTRQRPPLFPEDETNDNDEDLFASPQNAKRPSEDTSDPLRDSEDIFAEASEEVLLSGPDNVRQSHEASVLETEPLGVADIVKPKPTIPKAASIELATSSASSAVCFKSLSLGSTTVTSHKHTDEDSDGDDSRYEITVSVVSPKKAGEGVGAYMVYKVITKTNIPDFRKSEMEVYRRFSDFLGLHEKLVVKHLHQGRVIPAPPEKSVIGMTKIKISSEEASGSSEFVERRRAALERFINRVAAHPDLQTDPSFVDFLEIDGDLPRATSTSALSSAGVLRLFNRVGDSFGKIAFKVDEADQWNDKYEWFEEKTMQLETLDLQLKKLHASIEALVLHRRDLALNAGNLARAVAALGTAEEHTALSRALSQLSEVEERVESVHVAQSDADFYLLAELVHDYIGMVQAVKEVLSERVKLYRTWKDAEATLVKKREAKVRLELAHKMDKVSDAGREVAEWEHRVEHSQAEFEAISQQLHKELCRFDRQRCHDFKTSFVVYLESLMNTQQQLIKHWELFLPEAKAVI